MRRRPHDSSPLSQRRGLARGTALWFLGAALALGTWLTSFTVAEGEVAVVARFGDPRRTVEEAGLHFKWPSPIDTVYSIDVRTHLLDPEVAEFLTDDQKNVEVDAFVAWRVAEPLVFLRSLRGKAGAEERIGQVLQASLGDVLKRGPFDDLVSVEEQEVVGDQGPKRTLTQIRDELTEVTAARCEAQGYGVEIELVGIERITFPDANKPSVEGAMREQRNKEAARIEAEGREIANAIDTETKAAVADLDTAAESEATRIIAEGQARAKEIEKEAYALDPELFDTLARFEVMETALRGGKLILASNHWLASLFEQPPAVEFEPGVLPEPDEDESTGDDQ